MFPHGLHRLCPVLTILFYQCLLNLLTVSNSFCFKVSVRTKSVDSFLFYQCHVSSWSVLTIFCVIKLVLSMSVTSFNCMQCFLFLLLTVFSKECFISVCLFKGYGPEKNRQVTSCVT